MKHQYHQHQHHNDPSLHMMCYKHLQAESTIASKCIPKSSLKWEQTCKDCKCISKSTPLTGEKQLPNYLIPSVLSRRLFTTAVELNPPYVFVLRRPFTKAFTTSSLHVRLRTFQTHFQTINPDIFPSRKPFSKSLSNYLIPSYTYMFPLRRPVKKAVKLFMSDFSLKALPKRSLSHPLQKVLVEGFLKLCLRLLLLRAKAS